MRPSSFLQSRSQIPADPQSVVSIDRRGGVPFGFRVPLPWRWVFPVLALIAGSVSLTAANWATGKNRISLNSHIGFNIKADFTGLGELPGTNIGQESRGQDHYYNDGFNRVDATGNLGGQTWFWGYNNESQIVGDDVLMNSTQVPATGSIHGISDAPHWGAELVYARELGWDGSYWWGVEVGLSWVNLNFSDRRSMTADAVRTTDAYSLGGVVPPMAPYAGTFAGPGPTISDFPVRSVQTLQNAALVDGSYELDAYLYAMRVGLIYETPFSDWFTLQFGGGVLGGFVQSELSYRETTSVPGIAALEHSGSDRERNFLGGAYARAGFGFHFSPHSMGSVGVQYNYLGTFSHDFDGRRASVDLKSAIYVGIGFGISF